MQEGLEVIGIFSTTSSELFGLLDVEFPNMLAGLLVGLFARLLLIGLPFNMEVGELLRAVELFWRIGT